MENIIFKYTDNQIHMIWVLGRDQLKVDIFKKLSNQTTTSDVYSIPFKNDSITIK